MFALNNNPATLQHRLRCWRIGPSLEVINSSLAVNRDCKVQSKNLSAEEIPDLEFLFLLFTTHKEDGMMNEISATDFGYAIAEPE